ncbi:glycoside hydrolase family 2 protein [candidate division KSB1 bacterium]|nr:glycoside hydrolase family 2 protein [bacterium]NUM68064.1 glycoside hydrolase family 2 protein [candidate division KSB1 bacterium]
MNSIDLNGVWEFQPDWHSPRISQLPGGLLQKDEWLPASVPGTLHTDLLAAEKIPDPFYRDNEWQVQWVAEIGWRYRRTFHVPADFLSRTAIQFAADGLDTFAAIFINGRQAAETANMFVPHRFEVKPLLRPGENEIEIRFDSPMQRAQELEARYGKLPVALESYRVYARKAQYSFSWDWGPKLATSGIWRSIRLEGHQHLRIQNLFAEVHLDHDLQRARVLAKIAVEKFTASPVEFVVEISGPNFRVSKQASTSETNLVEEFSIDQPHLWWPTGYGEQLLYELKVRARVDGETEDEQTTRFGIRRLELVREPDAGGESFLFRLNNVPIFCKGADWIPADSFIPRIANEKYRALLSMAREANMNMLRIWGGGIYEQKIFYDLCDELGILVWQDFMFACGGYPDYPEFTDNVRREIATVVKQLRNHPCVVLWCGNNENEWIWKMETRRSYREMPGVSLFEKIIPEICAEHDPTRPYWQSSPFGGNDPNSESEGDRHQWNIWSNWVDPAAVAKDRGRFLSEFGFQAPATLSTWEKFLTPEDLQPQSAVFEHHNKQVEGSERLFRFLAGFVSMPHDFEDFVFKTQVVQAEALKTMVEHWRREKFHTAGALFWQLNDCWPVSSWAVIDSELQPKAAYWYARRFFAPLLVSFKPAGKFIEVWATNDALVTIAAEFEFEVLSFAGEVSWARHERVLIPANLSLRLAAPAFAELLQIDPRRQYLRARLRQNGHVVAENRHFFCRYKHLQLPPPHLAWQLKKTDEQNWEVQVKSDCFVKALALPEPPAGATLTENYFDLDADCEMVIALKDLPATQMLAADSLGWRWLS